MIYLLHEPSKVGGVSISRREVKCSARLVVRSSFPMFWPAISVSACSWLRSP